MVEGGDDYTGCFYQECSNLLVSSQPSRVSKALICLEISMREGGAKFKRDVVDHFHLFFIFHSGLQGVCFNQIK